MELKGPEVAQAQLEHEVPVIEEFQKSKNELSESGKWTKYVLQQRVRAELGPALTENGIGHGFDFQSYPREKDYGENPILIALLELKLSQGLEQLKLIGTQLE